MQTMRLKVEKKRSEHIKVISETHKLQCFPLSSWKGHAQGILSRRSSGGHGKLASMPYVLREDQWH